MLDIVELERKLNKIDGAGYKAYKEIQGQYKCGDCVLFIDYVQADPYAPPSKIRLRVPMTKANFPDYLYEGVRLIALEDALARVVKRNIKALSRGTQGTGKSGNIYIDAGKQQILKRSALKVNSEFVEARISIGLPAAGRRIKGKEARQVLCEDLPEIARRSLFFTSLNEQMLSSHVYLFEDQCLIREKLPEMKLTAFVADGSVLPRKSGESDLPMDSNEAVPFESPESFAVTLKTKHHGMIRGMGIGEGVNLIIGGGYHGKSTLLKAIERGVYNHIQGDGREWVITSDSAVKIRAEDGRNVEKVDITYFIDNLPFGQPTEQFSTPNASGSTSQAANIIEAVDAGAKILILDEDTSATNFMIRDARMQKLVIKDKEPITPFIDRVRSMYDEYGISTILVIGGAGDYLDVADNVIMLDSYRVYDLTEEAKRVAKEIKSGRTTECKGDFNIRKKRVVKKSSLNFYRGDKVKVSAKGLFTILAGKENIELDGVEQLVDPSQTRAIAECLRYMEKYVDDRKSLNQVLDLLLADMEIDLGSITYFKTGMHPGELAMPRRHELAAAINRLRSLKIQ